MKPGSAEAKPLVSIVGLGYVGLPLASLFASKGVSVIGIDIDTNKIEALRQGKSYLTDMTDREVAHLMESQRFEPTVDFARSQEADSIILCVPTPLRDHSYPDLSYVQSAALSLLPHLRKGQLVVLESSTFPGTTEEVLLPIFAKSGLTIGRDLFLGYSPERIDPGNKTFALEQIPKVVSGVTPGCLEALKRVYGVIFENLVPVTSPRAAEMTKLLENCQRFVNISFINEFAIICSEMGINVWEVIEAANTKPYGFTAYYPGPGVGGHCIPVDPLYLQWKAKQFGMESRFIQLAKVINDQMPDYVISRLNQHLAAKKTLAHCRILLVGITYKKDVNDVRESTALTIFEKLDGMGVDVAYHDPLVPGVVVNGKRKESVQLSAESLDGYDCVVLLTDHSVLPYDMLIQHARLLFDTRHAIKERRPNIIPM